MNAANDTTFTVKTHLSLNVTDIERSVRFYEAFLGVPAHKRRPGYANFDLIEPPLKLALQENPPTPGAGTLNHLGFQVATLEQVTAARQRLTESGLATFDEGDTVCCYARQDKIWAHDPDGNAWEVYVLLDDMTDDDDHDTTHAGACTACGLPEGEPMPMAAPLANPLTLTARETGCKPGGPCCTPGEECC